MLQVRKMTEKIEMTGNTTEVYLDRELVECNVRLAECNLKLAEHNHRLAEYHDDEEEKTTGGEEEENGQCESTT